MVMNDEGAVFIGERSDSEGSRYAWQMPQGGIDKGEDPLDAALRELEEETAIRSVELIDESAEWMSYDLPAEALGRWAGRYRGQTQKWFVMRFLGDDSEIDIATEEPEFNAWKWVEMAHLLDLVVPFKRHVYAQLIEAFGHLATTQGAPKPEPQDSGR